MTIGALIILALTTGTGQSAQARYGPQRLSSCTLEGKARPAE